MLIKKPVYVLTALMAFSGAALAQYAPQYPLAGHDAISRTDSRIVEWASNCQVTRGYKDIADPALGFVDAGSDENAIGPADGSIVSLGDGGYAVIEFETPIINGPGADFAVFENGFTNPEDDRMAFLELAFVEVSNDGETYYRFPSSCLLDTDTQNTNFTYTDASYIHNLAGKYIRNQGTPFDLEDLKDEEGLDVNAIRYIRIIDVIGIIGHEEFTSYDHYGNEINDPYPTPFPSGGFDLDAVAVLNNQSSSSADGWLAGGQLHIYPNPVSDVLHIELPVSIPSSEVSVYSIEGREIRGLLTAPSQYADRFELHTEKLAAGVYFIKLKNIVKSFVKR